MSRYEIVTSHGTYGPRYAVLDTERGGLWAAPTYSYQEALAQWGTADRQHELVRLGLLHALPLWHPLHDEEERLEPRLTLLRGGGSAA